MEAKENRPDACTASGTAKPIYKYSSTDTPDIQEESTGPFLPDDCAADIVSFCSEQTIAYDDLLEYATLPAQVSVGEVALAGCLPCPKRRARRVRFGWHARPGRTRAYARGGLWRGHVARQSCLLPGTPQGVSGVPRSEWDASPSRRRKLVGNRAHLGVRRGQ